MCPHCGTKWYPTLISNPTTPHQKVSPPWKCIFTSPPFWAILVAHTCNNWGYYSMISCIPLFVSDVYRVNLKNVSAVTCIVNANMSIHLMILFVRLMHIPSAYPYSSIYLGAFYTLNHCILSHRLNSIGIHGQMHT